MTPPTMNLSVLAFCALGMSVTMGGASAQSDEALSSLPGGPKNLLAEIAPDPAAILDVAGATRTADQWTAHLAAMGTAMTANELAMLAEYLALNTPAELDGGDVAARIASLPADGRELFAANCFSCHGVVKYYLLQDRDQAGWMDIFTAPYHRRLLTGDNERETFASYASHAMPVAQDQVPEAWKD
jgi:mono/diheme cytochrome c family protein